MDKIFNEYELYILLFFLSALLLHVTSCIQCYFACIRLGYKQAYLTTRDKNEFYAHLGYEYCEPIISLGSASQLLSDEHVRKALLRRKTFLGFNNI